MDILLFETIERILLSCLLGAIIGVEREWSGKSAGFRTMMLVSVGATLFTIVSYQMAVIDPKHESDVTRIASNIVTGIGFLGAGLIFRGDKSVHNLTTAAAVWASAAIGMAVGVGSYWLSVLTTVLVVVILLALQWLEERFEKAYHTRIYIVSYNSQDGRLLSIKDFFKTGKFKLLDEEMEKSEGLITATWGVRASIKTHDAAVMNMISDDRVKKMEH